MSKATVLGVGDLILHMPDIADRFKAVHDVLVTGDIVYGNVETPHTTRGQICNPEPRTVPPAPPENLKVLKDNGFTVCSFGNNHSFDHGMYGVIDTLDGLKALGIQTVGAGANIYKAREPAFVEKDGLKFAVLEYNCIGPSLSWATPMKAGVNFVKAMTFYETELCEPGAIPAYCYTFVDPWSLEIMAETIRDLKAQGYIIIVGLHIGRMDDLSILPYMHTITHTAVDNGAEIVLCCHAHEPRGIQVYKGKPIYHGLGNFVTLTTMMNCEAGAVNKDDAKDSVSAQLLYKPYEYPGVNPPAWRMKWDGKPHETGIPNYVFSHLSRNTLIAKGEFDENGIVSAGFIPCYLDQQGSPIPVTRDGKGTDVLEAFKYVNREEKLDDAIFSWNEDGTEVMLKLK